MDSLAMAKQRYEALAKQILDLQKEQMDVLKQIQDLCPHQDTYTVGPEPFEEMIGISEDPYTKCRDCGAVLQ